MFRNGMTINTVKKKMKKLSYWNFFEQKDSITGETNLVYYDGAETLRFCFGKNKKLIKAI